MFKILLGTKSDAFIRLGQNMWSRQTSLNKLKKCENDAAK